MNFTPTNYHEQIAAQIMTMLIEGNLFDVRDKGDTIEIVPSSAGIEQLSALLNEAYLMD